MKGLKQDLFGENIFDVCESKILMMRLKNYSSILEKLAFLIMTLKIIVKTKN